MVEPAVGTLNLYQRISNGVCAVLLTGTPGVIGVALARVLPVASYAPMSQFAPCGRLMPRWSVAGHSASLTVSASMAGLPGCSASVNAGPPLSANGPSNG